MTDQKGRDALTIKLGDLPTAMSILTRIPMPQAWVKPERLAASAWAFPLVGVLIGFLGGLVLSLLLAIGISPGIAAAAGLGAMVLSTGGLHEDGLADSADGLGGGATKERALEIMKDSRIGAYGTIILVLFLLGRWSAMTDLGAVSPIWGLIWVATVSRLPMVLVMTFMAHARPDGLSQHVGRPGLTHAMLAFAITILITLIILGVWGLLALLICLIACVPILLLARCKIGGQTGDILGGVQQCTELAALACLTALWI